MSPALAEHLVGQAAVGVLPFWMFFQIDFLNEVLAVEQQLDGLLAARDKDLATALGELLFAQLAGHLFGGPQGAQVQRADHRVGAVVVLVVGLVLPAFDQPVGIAVLSIRNSTALRMCGQLRFRNASSAHSWCSR